MLTVSVLLETAMPDDEREPLYQVDHQGVLHWTAAGRNHYSPWFHRFGIRLERIRTVDDLETARRICASGFQDH